jgi:phage host-nuclease inhibitor protein Gam
MGKRKQVETVLRDWSEVDDKLKEMCIHEAGKRAMEAEMNEALAIVRGRFERGLDDATRLLKEASALIEQFAMAHRADFGGKQTVERLHAILSYRVHPPAIKPLNRKWTAQTILDAVRRTYRRFVRTEESLDKPAILGAHAAGEVTQDELAQVGLQVVQDESFGIELKIEEAPAAVPEAE